MITETRKARIVGNSLFSKGVQSHIEMDPSENSLNYDRFWVDGEYKIGTEVRVHIEIHND